MAVGGAANDHHHKTFGQPPTIQIVCGKTPTAAAARLFPLPVRQPASPVAPRGQPRRTKSQPLPRPWPPTRLLPPRPTINARSAPLSCPAVDLASPPAAVRAASIFAAWTAPSPDRQ